MLSQRGRGCDGAGAVRVRRITLFRNADPVIVRALSRCLQPAYYLRNEYIVRKDDQANEIFFIDHGTVEVVSEDGSTVFDTLTSGEAFGEVGVMFNVPRTASVRAQVTQWFHVKVELF